MSRYATAVIFFSSLPQRIKLVVKINDVSVECHLLLPLCLTNILWLDVIYRDSWFNTTLSRTLESVGSSAKLVHSYCFFMISSLFLRIAQTSAIFQNIGTTPLVGEILMVQVNTGNNNHRRRALFNCYARWYTLSIPETLVLGIELTLSLTWKYSIVVKKNWPQLFKRWIALSTG